MRHFNISGYSTALFGTWYFIEDCSLLFDAGDGLSTQLLQKSRKIKHIFISHADRDHLAGLLMFNQLNARGKYPQVYYPKACASFRYLEDFSRKFDPHVRFPNWVGLANGERVGLGNKLYVEPFTNKHQPAHTGKNKSFSFHLIELRKKLKSELQDCTEEEIIALKQKNGTASIYQQIEEILISYSGDTPLEYDGRWDQSKVLIHEATFLNKEDRSRNNGHSTLEGLLEVVKDSAIERLVVGHFSSRYSSDEILNAILKFAKQYRIQIPIYAVLPGQTHFDILRSDPINA